MKIISWNLQAGGSAGNKDIARLLKLFEDHGADAVFVQEPTEALKAWGKSQGTEPKQPRGVNSAWKAWTFDGGTQGTIVVLTSGSTTLAGQLRNLGPFNLGQGTNRITQENPLVAGTLNKADNDEMVTFATCHAPYDRSIAGQYCNRAMTAIENTTIDNKKIDVWMGDLNTYGITMPLGSAAANVNYFVALASPTSDRGTGSPLDKAIINAKYYSNGAIRYSCGRIIPEESINQPDDNAPHGGVEDQPEKSWERRTDVPSDHLPIYLVINDDVVQGPTKKRRSERIAAQAAAANA